jgi:hypothetical protein
MTNTMTKNITSSICLAFILSVFWGQTFKAQENHKTVRGKYLGGAINETVFTNIKIKRGHRYELRKFTDKGQVRQVIKGTWTLEGNARTLTPKYISKDNGSQVVIKKVVVTGQPPAQQLVLVLQKGRWYVIGERKFTFNAVYTQYKRTGLYYKQRELEEDPVKTTSVKSTTL